MKTIRELSPIWTKYVEEHGIIPWRIDDHIEINGGQASIGNPACCFIGEARGGGCYYDKLLRDKDAGLKEDGSYVMIENPEYCEQCSDISQAFFHLSEGSYQEQVDQEAYKDLCQRYEKHYNKIHNGDKCEK